MKTTTLVRSTSSSSHDVVIFIPGLPSFFSCHTSVELPMVSVKSAHQNNHLAIHGNKSFLSTPFIETKKGL